MTNLELVSAIAGALFGLSVLAHLIVMFLTIIGLLWSPIAAAKADRYRADTGGSAKAAASMFLPWLYARKSMSGDNQMAPRTVRLGYRLVYVLWLLGPGGAWAGVFLYAGPAYVVFLLYNFLTGSGWVTYGSTAEFTDWSDILAVFVLGAIAGLIAYACLFDRRLGLISSLKRIRALDSGQANLAKIAFEGAIHPQYLDPFVRATLWSFASPVLLVVALVITLPIAGGSVIGN